MDGSKRFLTHWHDAQMQSNPFTPMQIARHLYGREEQKREIYELLDNVANTEAAYGLVRVELGWRGVGKTSLLHYAKRTAEDLGFATVSQTAGASALCSSLTYEIEHLIKEWGHGDVLSGHVREVRASGGIPGFAKLEVAGGRRPAPPAVRAFRDLVLETTRAATDDAGFRGLVVLIDEAQAIDDDSFRTLSYAWQELDWLGLRVPAVLLMAGLPTTMGRVEELVGTFGSRYDYSRLGYLEAHDTRAALSVPTSELGVSWETDALETVVEVTQGHPYLIHAYGESVWRAAGAPDRGGRLTVEHVETARPRFMQRVEGMLYAAWNHATEGEQRLLVELAAADGKSVSWHAVVRSAGIEGPLAAAHRSSLMAKGIIERTSHGEVGFCLPGLSEYIRSNQ